MACKRIAEAEGNEEEEDRVLGPRTPEAGATNWNCPVYKLHPSEGGQHSRDCKQPSTRARGQPALLTGDSDQSLQLCSEPVVSVSAVSKM